MSLEHYKEIKPKLIKMFDEHGVGFNIAVNVCMNVGWDKIDKVSLDLVRIEHEQKNKQIRKKGGVPLFSTDYWVETVALAKEIAGFASPWDILTFAKDYMPIDTGSMSVDRIKTIAHNAICLACDENMYAYDGDEWEEHVIEELDLDEEEYDEIMNEWG